MYASHFGLNDTPFSITPDPQYVYMSDRHREALAHLLYGIGAPGGFVQLTGEVGTGKTTICRCLLDQLPADVDIALILNPRLTDVELLAAVCDELRIAYPDGTTSLKVLVDAIHRYLLEAHARGRRTVLIIDEAQNLSTDVLEQIRLLTNLETTKQKLLQIILIGQPELVRLLDRPELRQLAQRVTARCHLPPLTADESCAYIRHRMEVAGQKADIFTRAAMREAHRLSGGIPRLINTICDRALLGAWAHDQDQIEADTLQDAASEVLGHAIAPPRLGIWLRSGAVIGAAALVAGIYVVSYTGARWPAAKETGRVAGPREPAAPAREIDDGIRVAAVANAAALPSTVGTDRAEGPDRSGATSSSAANPARGARIDLADVLSDGGVGGDKKAAFTVLYSRWGVEYPGPTGGLACERDRPDGLRCLFRSGTWTRLRRFNLPAVIELTAPNGQRRYATVTALENESATLAFGRRQLTVPVSEIDRWWDGSFIVLWKPPGLSVSTLHAGARSKDVLWLRQRLSEIHRKPVVANDPELYDEPLKQLVIAFQRSRALPADGVVGEETLAHLSTASPDATVPALSSARL